MPQKNGGGGGGKQQGGQKKKQNNQSQGKKKKQGVGQQKGQNQQQEQKKQLKKQQQQQQQQSQSQQQQQQQQQQQSQSQSQSQSQQQQQRQQQQQQQQPQSQQQQQQQPQSQSQSQLQSQPHQQPQAEDNKQNASLEQGVHPLEYEWTFWYDRSMVQTLRNRDFERNYESNLKPVGTFASVEDFWRISNHMNKPSELEMKSNYHLFKKGIKPMWEDPENVQGGKWTMEIHNDKELLDLFWENLNIGMTGETLEESDDICGAVVSRRIYADKISLWMRNSKDEETIMKIGKKMRDLLPPDTNLKLNYQMHEDSLRSGQSYANPTRFTA